MFIVTVHGKDNLWFNKLGDDFLQFLPAELGCEAKDLKVAYVPDSAQKLVKNHLKRERATFGRSGNVLNLYWKEKDDYPVSVEGQVELYTLKQWPYDQAGKFLGNALAEAT